MSDLSLDLKVNTFHLEVHPTKEIVAVATIEGNIWIGTVDENGISEGGKVNNHAGSARSLSFNIDGTQIYSVGADRAISICDVETVKNMGCKKGAHAHPINVVAMYDDNMLVSGDDEGYLNTWDARTGLKPIWQMEEHGDYVSDIKCTAEKKTILVTSGDGTLTSYEPRKGKVVTMCEPMDSELLSIAIAKNEKFAVCGSSSGALEVFKWGVFGVPCDRFMGHPEPVNTLCTVDPDTLCSGSEDGLIRVLSIQPNQCVGVLGEHQGGVQCVRKSSTSDRIFSCGDDGFLRVWNCDEDDEEKESEEKQDGATAKEKDDDDDSDSDEKSKKGRKRKKKRQKQRAETSSSKAQAKKSKAEKRFFDGL